MSERTFDDFDEYAEDYRSIHTANIKLSGADSFYFAEQKVRLLQTFEKNNNFKVLDIGCGDGATELFMRQYFPKWQVNGIDISAKSIFEAQQKRLTNATFSWYNGIKFPLLDESVDIVFIAGVLHHIEQPLHQIIMQEILRVLKKDGRVYLFEHNPLNPFTRYLVKTCVFDKDAKLLKSNYAMKWFQQGGFHIHCKKFIIFFPRKGIFSKIIFLERYLQWLPLGGQYFIRAIK